ncbi:MAG: hypothetical protein ACHQM4_09845 [Thermoanaerobaculia bacterium]
MRRRFGSGKWRGRAMALAAVGALSAAPALSEDLSVRLEPGGGGFVGRRQTLDFVLSREVVASEGRIAILIGGLDVSDLLEPSPGVRRYRPRLAPLPSGEQEIVVALVSGSGWKEIARLKLRVLTPGGFEKAEVAPKIDLTLKGQLSEGHEPAAAAPPRRTFQDLTGQANLGIELARSSATLGLQMGVQAAERIEDSLRFQERRTEADRIDLATWGMKFAIPGATLEWGTLSVGASRHLINGFNSRGGRAAFSLGPVTLSFAALNGSSIVGWDNFFGLQTAEHRVYAGTLGLELVPSAPGTLRVDTTLVDGSLLPRSDVNRGFVSDAEKSRGGGVSLASSLFGGRFRVEGGYSRNRFEAPPDPLLEQGAKVVPLVPTWRSASYASANIDVLKGITLGASTPATLSLAYRRERVDPQYRSVAATVQADQQQDVVEANAGLGPAALQLSYVWLEDNLADLTSILKTKTRRAAGQVALPLGALGGNPTPVPWLPQLSWSVNETHQFAANDPQGGGFSPTQLPDQISLGQTAAVEWNAGPARFGWHINYSDQDNRQVGREKADFLNTANVASINATPSPKVDLGLEVEWDRAAAKETGGVDRTKRYQMTFGLRPLSALSLVTNASRTDGGNDLGTASSRIWNVDAQTAWRFEPPKRGKHGLTGQILLRYAFQETRSHDVLLGVASYRKTWVVSSGISLSAF